MALGIYCSDFSFYQCFSYELARLARGGYTHNDVISHVFLAISRSRLSTWQYKPMVFQSIVDYPIYG